ncbi:hypothetical protein CsatB_003093 [Cannabis sativa]
METVGEKVGSTWGKCFYVSEASLSLVPSTSATQALSKFCLIGKVLTSKTLEEKEVETLCANLWKTCVKVDTPLLGHTSSNVFRFGFEKVADRRWVLDNGPWCIKGNSLVLLAWSSGFGPKELSFDNLRLWLQIHFLPHEFFTRLNANLIGAQAGKVLSIDLDESKPVTWNKWIRVQVEVDVNKPLFCGCFFKLLNGVNSWVQIKYENLGSFCYFCGCLGHQRGDCSLGSPVSILDVKGGKYPLFGPWLNSRSPYASCFLGNLHISNSRAKSFEKKVKAVVENGRPRVVNDSPSPAPVGGLDCGIGLGSREQVSCLAPRSRKGVFLGPRTDNTWVRKSSEMAKTSCARDLHDLGNGKLKQPLGGDPVSEDLPIIERNLNFKKRLESFVGAVIEDEVEKSNFILSTGLVGSSTVGPSKLVVSGPVEPLGCVTPVRLPAPQYTGYVVSTGLRGASGCEVLGSVGSGAMEVGGLRGPLTSRDVELLSKYSLDSRPLEKPVLPHGSTHLPSPGLDSDHVVRFEEERALPNFFKAREDYIHEIENLGSPQKNKRKSFGVDIGVQPTSECNDRTTPIKKRRLDFETLSLGEELGLSIRRFKRVVRDFPKGTGPNGGARDTNGVQSSDNYSEEPLDSEEVAKRGGALSPTIMPPQSDFPVSVGQSFRLTAWKAKARLADVSIPPSNVISLEDVGSVVGANAVKMTPVEEDDVPPPKEP